MRSEQRTVPTVSIIVPVYNAEKFLKRCLDSILNQEYADFELLLIDDGSEDTSGVICDSYAAADERVRVIHQANAGVSNARNLGLCNARGEYLQFLDSDDWITPNATKLLVEAAVQYGCDLVIADFYRVVGDRVSHKGDIEDNTVMTQEEFAAHMIENPADFYYGVLWNKLFRREIVEQYQLRMDASISWCEDFMFNLEYIRHANVFYALQVPIYYYVKTKGSLVTQGMSLTNTIKMKLMVFEYYNNFYKHVLDEEDYEKNRLRVYRFLVDAAKDGTVAPSIFPNSKKMGEERLQICTDFLYGEGPLFEMYRMRKLLDYYLEPAAIKNGITLDEIRLLFYLDTGKEGKNRQELADFVGVSVRRLSSLLQKVTAKKLVRIETRRGTKQWQITFLAAADPILKELADVRNAFAAACYQDFSPEQIETYEVWHDRIEKNIMRILL